ncbi:MAG: membrane protein insertase YidC [Zoogloeaceae bacterium]|jgi:YidC/Oxa1 family membrane protein insertase|nr:membrane protein insertase YidC [Zoogloeaceae bacterium]
MDTRRLILWAALIFSLFMLWENWQTANAPKPLAPTAATTAAPAPDDSIPTPVARAEVPSVPDAAASPTQAAPVIDVRTDLFEAKISADGGDLIWQELFKYKAHGDKSQPFHLFDPAHRYAAQSGFLPGDNLPTHKTRLTPLPGPTALADGQDTLEVRLAAPEVDGIRATKVYTFHRGSYLIDVAWEIENGSGAPISPSAYFQFQRDGAAPAGDSFMISTFYGPAVYTEAGKYQKVTYKHIDEGKAKYVEQADDGWLALVQHYFVTAWAPQGAGTREFRIRKLSGGLYSAALVMPMSAIAPGQKAKVSVPLFSGPQEQSVLKKVAPGLDLVVDYGWLHLIAAPLFWCLNFLHGLVGNWGWAIVILTILIKLIFYPLSAASYKSMARMRTLTPKLMRLKELHADDKQRLNQEMMRLYQTEKINPLGGCLPILVQIPVFIALYWVLLGAVEMRDAPWLGWIHDLSSADPYYVLPVIMMASMFAQTKLNPTPPDPIQAKMMMIMPLIFGVMFFFFPSGLVLYWVVNNLISIAQQWWITRHIEDRPLKAANDAKV